MEAEPLPVGARDLEGQLHQEFGLGDSGFSGYTVGRELGHGGDALVKRVYGHLGTVRHRAKVVEYRVTQHQKVKHRDQPVGEWLKHLQPTA